jgi:hypothetical protein
VAVATIRVDLIDMASLPFGEKIALTEEIFRAGTNPAA